jgi:hypothetical protein
MFRIWALRLGNREANSISLSNYNPGRLQHEALMGTSRYYSTDSRVGGRKVNSSFYRSKVQYSRMVHTEAGGVSECGTRLNESEVAYSEARVSQLDILN